MPSRCEYTHDVSGDLFDDFQVQEWECQRPARTDGNKCLFHTSLELRETCSTTEQLLDAVSTENGPLRLIGAQFESLELDYQILAGPSNHPIDLREATIEGEFSLRYATVKKPLRFEGATFNGPVDLEDATFTRRVDFGHVQFNDHVSFRMADFESWLDLRNVDFHEQFYSRVARFHRGIYGIDATFHAPVDFVNADFDDVANFYRATFKSGAVFDSTTFAGNVQLNKATIEASAVKLTSATGSPRSTGEHLEGIALSLDGVTCHRDLRLVDAHITGDIAFVESDLERDIRATGLTTPQDQIVIDCTGTSVISGEVAANGGRVMYDMTNAELGELDINDVRSFNIFRFEATTFNGFDFGSYIRELAAANWTLHERQSGASPEQIENLYLRAKNGAKAIGETRAAAEFFIKEMDHRRAGHWQRAISADGVGERTRGITRWLSNSALKITCGYGERPFRPVVFSIGIIFVFSLVYAGLDPPLAYSKPFGYLIFSAVNFVSIILGLPDVAGALLSFIIAVEAFIGGFIIALFVFTLTRSISR